MSLDSTPPIPRKLPVRNTEFQPTLNWLESEPSAAEVDPKSSRSERSNAGAGESGVIGVEVLVQCRDYFWTPSGRRAIALVVVFDQCARCYLRLPCDPGSACSLQTEQHASDTLDSEYEKLLLEQSVWAGYNRVDQLARETL